MISAITLRIDRPSRTIVTALAAALLAAALLAAPGARAQGIESLVGGNTDFAFNLYGKIRAENDGNIFLSPYSVSVALAMAHAGARGKTAEEMETVLGFGSFGQGVHPVFGDLRKAVAAIGETEGVAIKEANALWSNVGFPIRAAYLETAATHYAAEPRSADFRGAPEEARLEINAWAEENTGGMIPELIAPGMVDPSTEMVLANAVHFLGRWKTPFDPNQTSDLPFTTLDGRMVDTPVMIGELECGYFDGPDFTMIELPYGGGRLSMALFLPDEEDGLPNLERFLREKTYSRWIRTIGRAKVSVWLPKFAFSADLELSKSLSELGMPTAFTTAADFSGIADVKSLWIDWVVHGAAIDVDEEGTEAGAATAVALKRGGGIMFRALHPFFFVIRDRETGTVLFMGRVADPTQSG